MDTLLLTILGAAFAGGLILNVMPCVLPVLTMKVFHMIDTADASPQENRLHGLAYTGGILLSMMVLAVLVIALKASGELVYQGMQFQNPVFVGAITILMFVLGLNALGVFEFTVSVQRSGSDADSGGYSGSFFNGIIATIMATPCSAPFLGSAAVYAFAANTPALQTIGIFLMIGLGLASPFLLVSFVPALGRRLPRPGPWMETFKHVMGFSLLGAAVWLYGVMLDQIAPAGANMFLALLLVIGMGLWAVDRFGGLRYSAMRRVLVRVAVFVTIVGFGASFVDFEKPASAAVPVPAETVLTQAAVKSGKINSAAFNPDTVAEVRKSGRVIFMDFTANW